MKMLLAALCFAAMTAVSAPADTIVGKAPPIPTWPEGITLHSARCPGEGQQVSAVYAPQGPGQIKGCWVRALDVVVIRWDDGDVNTFLAKLFFPKESKT